MLGVAAVLPATAPPPLLLLLLCLLRWEGEGRLFAALGSGDVCVCDGVVTTESRLGLCSMGEGTSPAEDTEGEGSLGCDMATTASQPPPGRGWLHVISPDSGDVSSWLNCAQAGEMQAGRSRKHQRDGGWRQQEVTNPRLTSAALCGSSAVCSLRPHLHEHSTTLQSTAALRSDHAGCRLPPLGGAALCCCAVHIGAAASGT